MKSSSNSPQLVAEFDRASDVLYVTFDPAMACEGEGRPGGLELDFAIADESPCGVTVIGFRRNGWADDVESLCALTADHLRVPINKVRTVVLDVIKST